MEVLLILLWIVIAPVVLGIACIVQYRKIKRLEADKYYLEREIAALKQGRTPQSTAPAPVSQPKPPVSCPPQTSREGFQMPAGQPVSVPDYSSYYTPGAADRPVFRDTETVNTRGNIPPAPQKPRPEAAPDIRNINIVLGLGAMLVILSGYVFAAAAWGVLSPVFKTAVLMSVSVLFFGVHEIMRRKNAPENISRIFFILGSLFLPAAVAAGAVMRLFGSYLSFTGEGVLIVFAIMSALLTGCLFVGSKRFDSKPGAKAAFAALSLTAVFLTLHFLNGTAAALVLAVYTVFWTAAEPRLPVKSAALRSGLRFISSANIWILGIVSLFLAEENLFILPALIFSSSFFITSMRDSRDDRNYAADVLACAAYLLAGSLFSAHPRSFDEFVLTASLTLAVITAVSLPEAVPGEIRRIMSVISGVMGITAMAVSPLFHLASYEYEPSPLLLISAAAIFIQTLILALRQKNSLMKAACAGAFIWTAMEFSLLAMSAWLPGLIFADNSDNGSGLVFSFLILIFLAAVKYTPVLKDNLHTKFQEIITFAALVICLIICCGEPFFYSSVIWAMTVISAFISGDMILPPLSVFLCIIPLAAGEKLPVQSALLTAAAVFCAGGMICTVIDRKRPLRYARSFSMALPAMTVIWFAAGLTCDLAETLWAAVFISLFSLLNMIVSKSHQREYSGFFLFTLCLVSLDIGRRFIDGADCLIAPAFIIMLTFLVHMLCRKPVIRENTEAFLLWAMPGMSLIMTIFSGFDSSVPLIISSWILIFSLVPIVRQGRRGLLMYICMPWAILGLYYVMCDTWQEIFYRSFSSLTAPEMITLMICVLLCIPGRIFRHDDPVDMKNGGDYFALSALTAVILVPAASDENGYGFWFKLLTVAVIILNLTGRTRAETDVNARTKTDRTLFTIAALLGAVLWNCQPFFTLPEIIRTEYDLLPAAAFCCILGKIYGKTDNVRHISQVIAVICLGVLFIDAADTGYPADAVILGAVSLVMLAAGFVRRQRGYFLLGAVSLTAEALLLTVMLGSSSAWWAYLLIAGVILIAIGTVADMHRRGRDGIWGFLFKGKSAGDDHGNED